MNKKKLLKIRRQLLDMRKSPSGIRSVDFISLATQVGRTKSPVGKHPTYVRESAPALSPPLSIPSHPGDMKVGTAREIIDILLDDVDDWLMHLDEHEVDDDD